jgi:hypothetical protein
MKLKTLLPLGLGIAALALTGCATQKTSYGRDTNVLAGVVRVKHGAYANTPVNTIEVPGPNELFGNMADVSGTQTSILWGLFTINDY